MPSRRTSFTSHPARGELEAALQALRHKNEIPDSFPPEVLAEAEAARATPPEFDLREIPFVTLDPEGSQDLDQAFHLEPTSDGWILRYAIADLPSFVNPGGPLDLEARRRGQTLYLPDGAVPLHPKILSEDRVSLLPGVERTAFVWTIHTDMQGRAQFEVDKNSGTPLSPPAVSRALIRSRTKLSYESTQHSIDNPASHPPTEQITRLQIFGGLRIAEEQRRGGASLNMADEEIVCDATGYHITRSFPLQVEEWNAQLSLLTGMAAARLMLDGGVGVIRTMPPPDAAALEEFRTRVTALGQHWSTDVPYGEYLRTIPRDTATGVAVLHAASSLFRGADYAVFGVPDADGTRLSVPEVTAQAAIAAPYAHVTAPLRRLVDRWGLVICEALSAGAEIPDWVTQTLPELPALMRTSVSFAGRVAAEALDRVEAALLHDRIGEIFTATVLDQRESGARVQIEEPPVTARSTGGLTVVDDQARVRVVRADIASGEILLASP